MRLVSQAIAMMLSLAMLASGSEQERELADLEQQIGVAIVKRDLSFVDRVWDDDFFYTGVRGEVKRKADILAELKSGELKFESMKFDDIRIRVYADTAVVTGRATTKGRSKMGEITGAFRYTRVYVKREGRWRLVAFQGTPLAKS
jgi:ketosteroid isomerase-like protein